MPKFKQGETSKGVIEKKDAITKSIIKKSNLIDQISEYKDIPLTLEIKKESISESSVHKWNDPDLDVISYSRNTAHQEHNSKALELLINSIYNANIRLSGDNKKNKTERSTLPSRLTEEQISQLRKENEELRIALAEVYRAYMDLLGQWREDKQIDAAYRKLILEQSRILGKKRMWEVK